MRAKKARMLDKKIHGGKKVMRINNNIMALNTHRQYSINNNNAAKSTEKLSSGYRINRAGDDAAGLAISEKMRAQIRGLNMASKNSNDAISLVQTAEGALTETHSILQRMRELAVQAASDTNDNDVDRAALDAEFQELKKEIDDIAGKTAFNGKKLLDGTFGSSVTINTADSEIEPGLLGVTDVSIQGFAAGPHSISFAASGTDYTATFGSTTVTFAQPGSTGGSVTLDFGNGQIVTIKMSSHTADDFDGATLDFNVAANSAKIQTGANAGDTLSITIGSMTCNALSLSSSAIGTQTDAAAAIAAVNEAINTVSTQRANLGATQNRLEHKINNLDTSAENLQAAESRIRDLDMAKEMTTFTKNNILVQAATAMLAQANQAPQNVLALLK
jgi:flagellin